VHVYKRLGPTCVEIKSVNILTLIHGLRCVGFTDPIVFYCLTQNLKEIANLVAGPRWAPDAKTDWPTHMSVVLCL
jgi:hypothetical protein